MVDHTQLPHVVNHVNNDSKNKCLEREMEKYTQKKKKKINNPVRCNYTYV